MKRPNVWLQVLLAICAVVIVAEYVALTQLAPHFVIRTVEHAAGGELTIEGARLSFPFTTRLTALRLINNTSQSALTIQRAVIRPRWVSFASKTLEIDSLELERPLLRFTRTPAGTTVWPTWSQALTTPSRNSRWDETSMPMFDLSSWHVHIATVKILDGVVEFVDEVPSPPFHGLLDHLSIVIGPMTVPITGVQMSSALRGRLVGAGGAAAPLYCSGWLDLTAKDLQASCQLDSIALAAFDPYFHGRAELRVASTTLQSTSQWSARANDFSGRVQFELGNLNESDLSIHGRTVIDIRRLAGNRQPQLKAEVQLVGPLDAPDHWHAELVPGDSAVQQLLTLLLNRGVESLRIPFAGVHFHISLAPASQATMSGIESTSREIQEALEILSLPPTEAGTSEVPTTTATTPGSEITLPATPSGETTAAPAGVSSPAPTPSSQPPQGSPQSQQR